MPPSVTLFVMSGHQIRIPDLPTVHLASCERAHLYSPLQMFPADSKIGKLGMTNLHHSTICTEILSVNSFR